MLRSTFCEMSSCGLKSRISITAGHRPAGRMRTLHDCLKGRTVIPARRPAFQAVSQERRLIRGSLTRGYENQAPTGLGRVSTACKTVPCVTSVKEK
jgi:hypothetical protein